MQCDASQSGLGACIIQDQGPICFASRSLSDVEKRYSQIEKGMLAFTFAANKFHYYIYGRSVEVHSDHMPLIPIFQKDLSKIYTDRLQRMKLKQ